MIQQPLSQFLLLPRPGVPLSGLRWMRFKARNLSSAKSLGVTTCYDHIKNELEVRSDVDNQWVWLNSMVYGRYTTIDDYGYWGIKTPVTSMGISGS